MKALRFIIVFSTLHFIAACGLFVHAFGSTMNRFDTGTMPGMFDKVCNVAIGTLWCPFVQDAQAGHYGRGSFVELILFFANSLLWGIILYMVFWGWKRLLRWRCLRVNREQVA